MKKLIVTIIVAGALSAAGAAAAHGHHDGRVYVEFKGEGYEIGGWFALPFPRMERRHGGYDYENGHGRHNRDGRRSPGRYRRESSGQH
jgi:hypothetical protein